MANERSIPLYLAIRKVVEREKWDFYTIQSFLGLGDDYCATCFAQSMTLENGIPTSTLGDLNTALTTFLLTKLSKERVYYGDLQHVDRERIEVKIIGDGAIPPSLAGKVGSAGFTQHGIPTERQAGGLAVRLICKAGDGVLARLGRRRGQFVMVIARVSIFEPSEEEVPKRLAECGIPFWPHGFVSVHGDIQKLLEVWMNEYACLGYGAELYSPLIDFCEMVGIETVTI